MRGDIAARPIAWVALTIAAVVVLVIVAVFLLLRLWHTDAGADRVRMPDPVAVPGPALQTAPQPDLQAYLAEKQRLLETGALLDAQRGIARIPIADAMALLAASAASGTAGAEAKP
jgi:hypothetical protein